MTHYARLRAGVGLHAWHSVDPIRFLLMCDDGGAASFAGLQIALPEFLCRRTRGQPVALGDLGDAVRVTISDLIGEFLSGIALCLLL